MLYRNSTRRDVRGGAGLRELGTQEQAIAVRTAQDALWTLVVTRFRELERERGLRQADLARSLGAYRPQIHEWLSDPSKLTIKAAGRLLAAMDAELACELKATDRDPSAPALRPQIVVKVLSQLALVGAPMLAQMWTVGAPLPAIVV